MIQIKSHTLLWGRHEKDDIPQTLEFGLGTDLPDAFRLAKLLAELNQKRVLFSFNGFHVDTAAYPDVETLMTIYYGKPSKENQNHP